MTTYQEISTSEEANKIFWTEQARFLLSSFQYAKTTGHINDVRLAQAGFRKAMKNRKEKLYFA